MKNFKGQKNFRKKAPLHAAYGDKHTKMVRKVQKDRLWTLIIKGGTTLLLMILGFIVGNLPGVLLGAIVGYQIGKYLLEFLKKKVRFFKKIFKNPYK